jgi:hypothetical protein
VRLRPRRSPALTRPRAAWLAAALAAACAGGDAADRGVVVEDSAGVAIVANTRPARGGAVWRVAAEPLLDLGGDESTAPAIFERVAGILLLPDGGLVAGDEGAGEIRAFDPAGRLRWRTGRRGDGPGEFRLIAALGVGPADSIWVFDFGNRRFTILDTTGLPARTLDLGPAVSAPAAVGRLPDGSFLLREMWGTGRDEGRGRTGMQRDPAAIVRLAGDGARLDTLAVYPGREVFLSVEDGRGVMNTPRFARNTAVALAGDRILAGDQAVFAIDMLSPTGAKQRSARIEGRDLTLDREVIARAADALLEPLPRSEQGARRRMLEALPQPPTRPAFGRIVVSGTGEIWISEHAPPPLEPGRWYVLDADGRWLGDVTLPERFRLEAVGPDRVAGVWRDDIDVEHIRVHALRR